MSISLDSAKGDEPILTYSVRFSTPLTGRGVKIPKIRSVPDRNAQSLRPFGCLFRYVFAMGSCPSRAVAFAFAASDMFAFLLIFC